MGTKLKEISVLLKGAGGLGNQMSIEKELWKSILEQGLHRGGIQRVGGASEQKHQKEPDSSSFPFNHFYTSFSVTSIYRRFLQQNGHSP